jgi:glycerophosphoryl diester phosphodiesterase
MKNILPITLFFFILSCSSSKKNTLMNKEVIKSPVADFDKQGHRGCRGLMPENTIPAMINALGLGVTTLEMDVVITKDKQVILSHEPFFNHEITTKADGSFVDEKEEKNLNIFKMTYAETKQYDVGLKPHPRFPQQQKMAVTKPSLANVFEAIKKDMMTRQRPFPYYNIETKTIPATDNIYHPAPTEFVELLMKVIREKQMEDYVIIQSFDFRTLQYLHKHYPTIKTAMLVEAKDKNSFRKQVKDIGFTPTIYSPEVTLVTQNLIDECHQQNIKIIPWTVNDKKGIDRLKALGVDGIISDYPDLFNE